MENLEMTEQEDKNKGTRPRALAVKKGEKT